MSRRPTNYYITPGAARSSTPGRFSPQQQQMAYAPVHSPPGQASMQPSYNHSHSSSNGSSDDGDPTEIYNRDIHVYFQITSFEASNEYLADPKAALGPLVSALRSSGSWLDVLHYGIELENPNRGFIMIAWPDPEAALRTNDYNSALRMTVRRNTVRKEYWLEADTYLWGVLSAPAVSFSVVKQRRSDSRRLVESTAAWSSSVRRCPGYRDHWFQSNILSEDGREFIVMIGWDGLRAHQDSRYTPTYQEHYRSVEDLGYVETKHVRLTRYSVYIH